MNTCLNGTRPPRKYRLNITMRLTHSVMISRAVDSTALGFHFSRRPCMSKRAGSGQPNVESGHSAELNQVSSTSSSWRKPAAVSAGIATVSACSATHTKRSYTPSGRRRTASEHPMARHSPLQPTSSPRAASTAARSTTSFAAISALHTGMR